MSKDLVHKLAEQAGLYVDDNGKVWGDPAYDITEQFNKFVELMVHEFVNHAVCYGNIHDEWYTTTLKDHLGIKQGTTV